MNILGISAYYHDSAACLVREGDVVAACQEERFTRKKHDHRFPESSIDACLDIAGIRAQELDLVAFYEKPFLKFERLLETYLATAPRGLFSFLTAMPLWIKQKLWIADLIKKSLGGYEGKIVYPEHHESHAASAFFPSPFKRAAFLTMDGVGEWTTASFGTGEGNRVAIWAEIKFPHSLGLLYSAFTYYTGFRVNSGEYKVMGLAPYGEPRYTKAILDELIEVKDDGSFWMNMDYFDYMAGLHMTSEKFHNLFGGPPRKPESPLTQRDMDLAASVQEVTELIMLRAANHVYKETGEKNLCLAGGVALNCVGNGRILREGPFENIWIQPAAGDAGGALGAALFAWHQYLGSERSVREGADSQRGSFLGPDFTGDEIETFLTQNNIPFKKLAAEELADVVSDLLLGGSVVGWFQGRMEFGPRALGARSIIGDARSPAMQSTMNLKIKFRESFRPFAPSVLGEEVHRWFDLAPDGCGPCPSPYMLLVGPVKKEHRRDMTDGEKSLFGIDKLNVVRSKVPAITHVNYSARVQTVHEETNPRYHEMISKFFEKTGCPVIVNTSFNVRGEPIVMSPEHAYTCFMRTEMDYLVLENFLLAKEDQPAWREEGDWREEFELD